MRHRRRRLNLTTRNETEDNLPVPWQRIQGAIWLAGLAILLWQGWIWPGILVLIALSGLFQAAVQLYLSNQEEQEAQANQVQKLDEERANWLPAVCPTCGGPVNMDTVRWVGQQSASCPYCGGNLRPVRANQQL